jgi:hypothetical protein
VTPKSEGGIILSANIDEPPSVFTIESLIIKANVIHQFPAVDFPDLPSNLPLLTRLESIIEKIEQI